MIKKSILFVWVASLFLIPASSAQGTGDATPLQLSLEECIGYALGDNYTKQSVQLNEESREVSLQQSRMNRLPSVSANLSENVSRITSGGANLTGTSAGGANWNGSYDVSTNVTVYQGGQINNTIKQNELQYEQTKLQTQQYDNDLTIQVLQSFLTALGNEELLKYQESILESSEKQVVDGKAKYEAGQILESDYLLLEAQYATDLDNITTTRINFENSLVALKNLMSMDLLQPITLVVPDDSVLEQMLGLPSRAEVVTRGMETMPDVKISDYNVVIAESGVKISKSALYPTISVGGSIATGHSRNYQNFGTQLSDRFSPQAGITLSIPIFNRGQSRSNVKQSQIAYKQAQLERQQSINDIEQTLINEYGNVVASGSKYKASEIKQNAYLSSFNAYTEMFSAGSITAVDLLQQQNNYISAMNDYVQNKYTFMMQRKVLDVYMGEPIKM